MTDQQTKIRLFPNITRGTKLKEPRNIGRNFVIYKANLISKAILINFSAKRKLGQAETNKQTNKENLKSPAKVSIQLGSAQFSSLNCELISKGRD